MGPTTYLRRDFMKRSKQFYNLKIDYRKTENKRNIFVKLIRFSLCSESKMRS